MTAPKRGLGGVTVALEPVPLALLDARASTLEGQSLCLVCESVIRLANKASVSTEINSLLIQSIVAFFLKLFLHQLCSMHVE